MYYKVRLKKYNSNFTITLTKTPIPNSFTKKLNIIFDYP